MTKASSKRTKKSRCEAPYGSWKSPIDADLLADKTVGISELKILDREIFWLESRPSEKGRCTVVSYNHGHPLSIVPKPFNVRSTVHEYGGNAWIIGENTLYFVNQNDQEIYRIRSDEQSSVIRVTKESDRRYADLQLTPTGEFLIAICEDHEFIGEEPVASIVAIDVSDINAEPIELVKGADFYANARINATGDRLLWLEWNHPNMPWTKTVLKSADFKQSEVSDISTLVEGDESVFDPKWNDSDDIFYISDRDNWWNLYKYNPKEDDVQISKFEREAGLPLWQFGMTTWGFLGDNSVIIASNFGGLWNLSRIELQSKIVSKLQSNYNYFNDISTDPSTGRIVVIAADGKSFHTICEIEDDKIEPLYADTQLSLPVGSFSIAHPVKFQTMNLDWSNGFYYPPQNSGFRCTDGSKPPLIVMCHGGPTGSTNAALNLKIQFWTSRGFAVADVNYRGSTGYGRDYRLSLDNNWGIHDVDDACAIAEYCADKGWVDRDKLIIRGSSAGGYTVLSALCFQNVFSAGCSLYGIGDLNALISDTHKFEAQYPTSLIASPKKQEVYEERSPFFHIDKFNCPVIFFQGLKDKVVPPNQAQKMCDALEKGGFPVSLVTYSNEAHGFRQAKTIIHSLNTELAFYGKIFGFDTDAQVSAPDIKNADKRHK